MKQKITKNTSKAYQWFATAVLVTILIQVASAAGPITTTLYSNATTRETDGGGNPLYFAQSGYEYGDEVVLSPAYSAVLNEFKLEYYGLNLNVGAQMKLRIYANDGNLYGTNFAKPGTLIYNGSFFNIVDGAQSGFGTYTFNQTNSGFSSVTVPPRFTWTVEFANITNGTAGLALYNPPTIGSNFDQYWEASEGMTNGWVYRKPIGFDAVNFGAVAKGTLNATVMLHVVYSEGSGSALLKPVMTDGSNNPLTAGKPYKVTVTATPGTYWYSNAILVSAYSKTNYPGDIKAKKGKFKMILDADSTLTVYCVTNRFIDAAGEYYGLFSSSNGVSQDSSGLVTLKVTSKRAFSGVVRVAGDKLAFGGTFGLSGVGFPKAPLTSTIQTVSSVINLQLNFDGTVSGSISNQLNGVVSTLSAKQYKWSQGNPATNYTGQYTMVLSSLNSATSAPKGYSVGAVTIDSLGVVQLKGTAADGYKVTQKTKLSPSGDWPLFCQYGKSTSKVLKGSMFGALQVLTNGTERASGTNTWIRTAFSEAFPAGTYTSGFTNVSAVKLQKFTAGPAVVNLPSLVGTIKLTGIAGITSNAPVSESIALGTITPNLPNPYGYKVALKQTDGSVKGRFANPDNASAKVAFFGTAMQGDHAVYGYFILSTSAESLVISNP